MAWQPGLPGNLAQGEDWMVRELQDIRREMRELAAANPFVPMGITPTPNGFTVTGTETVNGPLIVNGTETVNGPLNVNGAMAVTGTLSLPAGIINNAALSSPVSPLATHAGTNNFGLATGANVQILASTITVPAGYSQALVFATATMHAYNNNAGSDDAFVSVRINGASVGASSQGSAAGNTGLTLPATGTTLLTGLGSTFQVQALGSSGSNAWASSGVNFVNLDIMTMFLR